MDIECLNSFLVGIDGHLENVISEWIVDAQNLVKLCSIMLPSGIGLGLDEVLDDKNKELLANLLDGQMFNRCGNAARLFASWCSLMKKGNSDGCGSAFPSPIILEMESLHIQALRFCELSKVVQMLLVELPNIKNRIVASNAPVSDLCISHVILNSPFLL